MATTVYDVIELVLQDGTEVTVRPLDLKRLRKVMKVIEEMNAATVAESDTDTLDFLIAATRISLEKQLPDLVKDEDKFEEAMDLPTMWKILEVAAGVSMGSPNLQGEAAQLGLI